jgi:hypothetical protein
MDEKQDMSDYNTINLHGRHCILPVSRRVSLVIWTRERIYSWSTYARCGTLQHCLEPFWISNMGFRPCGISIFIKIK